MGKTRCAKCGGGVMNMGNAKKELKSNVTEEEHSAAYKGREANKRAVQVQNVRVNENIC